MKNMDIFGGETEVNSTSGDHRSEYQKFKQGNNYRKSTSDNKCGNCAHHESWKPRDYYYHKCELLGFSMSEATDIRVGHVCDQWKNE